VPPSARAAQPTLRADPEYLIDTWETDDGLPENSATAMVQDRDGYLWFGTFRGLVRFDGVEFTRYDEYEHDPAGITARAGGGRIAWFHDPDGNTFAIEADT